MLVKNTPFDVTIEELRTLFGKFGGIARIVLPPSHTMALVEMNLVQEARAAFRGLAYRRFHNEPLYLEWAPAKVFSMTALEAAPIQEQMEREAREKKQHAKDGGHVTGALDADVSVGEGEMSSIFVKNLNWASKEEDLAAIFAKIGAIRSVKIATKKDPKNPGKTLSMGFAFVEFVSRADALEALKRLPDVTLDGHPLEMKMSTKVPSFLVYVYYMALCDIFTIKLLR